MSAQCIVHGMTRRQRTSVHMFTLHIPQNTPFFHTIGITSSRIKYIRSKLPLLRKTLWIWNGICIL